MFSGAKNQSYLIHFPTYLPMPNEFRNPPSMLVRQRFWAITLFHFLLIATSVVVAWLLRFDFRIPFPTLLLGSLPILILFRVAALARFNLLHGYWRHSGVTDVIDIGKAVTLGSLAFFVTTRYVLHKYEFPFSIYILEAIITAAGLAGARLCAMALKSKAIFSFSHAQEATSDDRRGGRGG